MVINPHVREKTAFSRRSQGEIQSKHLLVLNRCAPAQLLGHGLAPVGGTQESEFAHNAF